MQTKKKSAPVLQHRDAHKGSFAILSIPAILRFVKRCACLMGCLFCCLGVLMFYGALIEGMASWSGSLAMCGICVWMCRVLYQLAQREEELW